MTTSTLMTHTRSFNDNDLQTLRDFAIEAPWSWRMALEQLVDAAEEHGELESAREELDAAKSDLTETKRTLEKLAADLDELIPGEGTQAAKFLDGMPWANVKMPMFREALQKVHERMEKLHRDLLPDEEKK